MIKLGSQEFHVPPPGGGETFDFQQTIIPVATRLASALAPLIPVWMAANKEKGQERDLTFEEALTIIPEALPRLGEVFSHMPPGQLGTIRRILLGKATCGKVPLFGSPAGDAFDGLLAGRTMDVWRLLVHAMEVWYPDFFGGARALLARRAAPAKPSETSSTSSPAGPVGG